MYDDDFWKGFILTFLFGITGLIIILFVVDNDDMKKGAIIGTVSEWILCILISIITWLCITL